MTDPGPLDHCDCKRLRECVFKEIKPGLHWSWLPLGFNYVWWLEVEPSESKLEALKRARKILDSEIKALL